MDTTFVPFVMSRESTVTVRSRRTAVARLPDGRLGSAVKWMTDTPLTYTDVPGTARTISDNGRFGSAVN